MTRRNIQILCYRAGNDKWDTKTRKWHDPGLQTENSWNPTNDIQYDSWLFLPLLKKFVYCISHSYLTGGVYGWEYDIPTIVPGIPDSYLGLLNHTREDEDDQISSHDPRLLISM